MGEQYRAAVGERRGRDGQVERRADQLLPEADRRLAAERHLEGLLIRARLRDGSPISYEPSNPNAHSLS
jgi:hypothetical protein